ncbi:acyl-CoA dehydrogenase [Amycolatopsis acidicola]|uniref:Acyl-CoA dehydrogenase n=1 Tax=Amycolatopsis acidicola TaxID=2596893 RepID=A0A5N0UYV7_9PSEU|nr:acyl-CoA dehydrogenase family protein [Amycolatopsis acidicola]KAA9156328.1 acyl-CoA dehydrogenase [Amycolatopsis acidicola]
MRFTPDADAEELRAVVRDFLEHDAPGWERFAGELGVGALDVPEEFGGAGASFREVAVVAEELGRSLAPLPWFATSVLATGALLAARGPARDELLTRLAATATTATVVHDPGAIAAVENDDGWRLTGKASFVVDGASAEVVLVPTPVGLFAVEGITGEPMRTMDPNRPLATLRFDGAPAMLIDTTDVRESVRTRALAALACEQTGGAAVAMEMSVAYAGQRVQFGRPIATFQAVKHRCADMAVRVEAARSASLWAAAAIAEGAPDAAEAAATAALVCGEAYAWVAAETVQVHGGIGFTWEHPAHLHVRRAATSRVLLGEPHTHRERLLTALGI